MLIQVSFISCLAFAEIKLLLKGSFHFLKERL